MRATLQSSLQARLTYAVGQDRTVPAVTPVHWMCARMVKQMTFEVPLRSWKAWLRKCRSPS